MEWSVSETEYLSEEEQLISMYTVYILKSLEHSDKIYIGLTENFEKRLQAHNAKQSLFSKRYSPWELSCQIIFADKSKAAAFEKYLKQGSGFAFLKKHLL